MLHLSVGKHYLEGFQFRSSYVSLHSVSVGYNFMSDLIPIFPSCIPELRNPIYLIFNTFNHYNLLLDIYMHMYVSVHIYEGSHRYTYMRRLEVGVQCFN